MTVPQISIETLSAILEQDAREENFGYYSALIDEIEEKQPEVVAFARTISNNVVEGLSDELSVQSRMNLLCYIVIYMLVPIKALYNQIECNELEEMLNV